MTAIWEEEENKLLEDQRNSALTGWQIYTIIKQTGFLGNAKLIKYPEYLANLGLLKEHEKENLIIYKKLKREQNKVEAANNIIEAQRIADMVKQSNKTRSHT